MTLYSVNMKFEDLSLGEMFTMSEDSLITYVKITECSANALNSTFGIKLSLDHKVIPL